MRPLHFYLVGTATWFMGFGIQGVMFAWLVAMVLRESPEMVGIAQMTLLLPGTILILIGGSYADRFGGRRVAVIAQTVGALAPLFLLSVVGTDSLTYSMMLCYAILMGCAQAFVTPARDGLLNQVAEGRVQRTVMLTSMMQFGAAMVGFMIAATADVFGPEFILGLQSVVLLLGVYAFVQIGEPDRSNHPASPPLLKSVLDGGRAVFASPALRMVMVQNMAMGMFFMGTYIVTMPLLVREIYAGSAQDLAFMNAANSLGLVLTIFLLLRIGDIRRQGRALLLAQGIGAFVLAGAAFTSQFSQFVLIIFFWGVCGGAAMTMSRTIMQEQAPETMRGRVMSFYSFSFMGAGPIGALLSGYLVEELGPELALLTSAAGMLVVIILIGVTSGVWNLQGHTQQIVSEASEEAIDTGGRTDSAASGRVSGDER